jgi:hypothetical protein
MGEPMDEIVPADQVSEESEEDARVVAVESERRRAAMHRRIRASRRDQGETSGWALQTRQPPSLTRSNVHWM